MLTDDELDFDDFGDLGDIDGGDINTEELEKELELEFNSDLPSTNKELEEGETKEEEKKEEVKEEQVNETTVNTTTTTTTTNPPKQKKQYNGFNNNNPHYAQQQQQLNYIPDAFMNPMFAPYPQFSNRIYVNPKFNKANPQHLMQQQRQYMEAQRMMLMQQQLQLQQFQEQQQRLAEMEQKRKEAAEMMRKRREEKQANEQKSSSRSNTHGRDSYVGEKRDKRDYDEENNRQVKRQETTRMSPAGGISIKGAAARSQQANNIKEMPARNKPYTPPAQRGDIQSRLNMPKSNITSRLSKPVTKAVVPIATNGKSNTLIIHGLSENTSEADIKKLSQEVRDIHMDTNQKSATISFANIESAVTFRRKYNRMQLGDSHITITFQK